MSTINQIWMRGFKFEWIEIPDLCGLFQTRNVLSRFDRVRNRHGLYIFASKDETCVFYVGMSGIKTDQEQDLRKRISQYFKNKRDKKGNKFAKNWMEKENLCYRDYKNFIDGCKLATLSTEIPSDPTQQKKLVGETGIISAMEKFLIYELKPFYNAHVCRLTYGEENSIRSIVNVKL